MFEEQGSIDIRTKIEGEFSPLLDSNEPDIQIQQLSRTYYFFFKFKHLDV